ncbi:tyrosine-protein phosphatase [Paraferrimonas sedimenticola]|uniref:protein-tyrosine-phosphatase n=1 Tax=Paraferrimonas sedimenticola TaxID=375674 RepID=A0AA37RVJ0_9GAMM|nr:CpsB/CapC family capsule biosynthesis tyrosine phosphatase [Paraferrimonas sedimenticola]GLP96019.1 tyrosine protein phosphatase [Paraferrimonas sedimenticola]
MIDLHCHLLPDIDDGPDTLDMAVSMAKMALEDGIHHSVLTPHITPGRFNNQQRDIEKAGMKYRSHLAEQGIELGLSFAAEVRLDPVILTLQSSGQLPYLGQYQGKNVVLLEMPHGQVPPGATQLVSWLIERDVLPMIAHPERNRDVWYKPAKLQPLLDQGCLVQITAGSLLGQFRQESYQRACELLQDGLVNCIATDAHNLSSRPPKLAGAVAKAAELVGEAQAKAMVLDFPQSLLSQRVRGV